MPPLRCLLCDAMGTLVALRAPAPALRRQLAARFGVSVSVDEAQAAIAAEISYYRAHMLEGRDANSVRALQMQCAEELWAALPPADELSTVEPDQMTEVLLASLHFDVFDDVIGALHGARAAGWRVVVVSNWDQSLSSVLARAGLAPWLDGVVTSAEIGAAKPDPTIFGAALSLAGVTAGDAVHVGDSLDEDVAGARAAGIRAIWLRRDGSLGGRGGPAGLTEITGLDALAGQLWP